MHKPWCISVILLMLTACDPWAGPETMVDEYLVRLARVLDVENQSSDIIQLMTLPRPRDRRIDIAPLQINMLDFLSLYGCELQVVVGERNSILGRVMTPLNTLRYQQRFIDKAQQCLPKVEKTELKNQLRKAIEYKKATLPAYFWNAVWADEPMAALMTQSKGLFDYQQGRTSLSQLTTDLDHTVTLSKQVKSGSLDSDLSSMGDIQQRWVFNHQPGQLINSARLLITRLNDASSMIEQRLGDKPLCYLKKPNKQSERMKGLFFHVYIGKVQPYLAKVNQAGQQIFARLSTLASTQDTVMPETFKPFYDGIININQPDNVWRALASAIERHTKHWQKLLDQCGMRPGTG